MNSRVTQTEGKPSRSRFYLHKYWNCWYKRKLGVCISMWLETILQRTDLCTAEVLPFYRARPVHQDVQRHKQRVVGTAWDITLKDFFSSFTVKELKFLLGTRHYTHTSLCAVPHVHMAIQLDNSARCQNSKKTNKQKQLNIPKTEIQEQLHKTYLAVFINLNRHSHLNRRRKLWIV